MRWTAVAFITLLVGCDSTPESGDVAGQWYGEFEIQVSDADDTCDRYYLWTVELVLAQPVDGNASGTGSLSGQEVFEGSGCQEETMPRIPTSVRVTGTVAGDRFGLELWFLDDTVSPSFTYQGILFEGQLVGTFYADGGLTSATLEMDRT